MDALYISASGMLAQNQSLSLIAGNLANANSPGYLAQTGTMMAFPAETVGRTGSQAGVVGASDQGVAFSSGILAGGSGVKPTSSQTDLALLGSGFFTVRTPAGVQYTRDGQFNLDAHGRLVTAEGGFVLGTNGKPIQLAAGPFSVSPTGVVSQGNATAGQLALTNLRGPLKSQGQNLYTGGAKSPFTGSVLQSSLNTSNVNLAEESTAMIEAESRYQSLTEMVNEESTRLQSAAGLGILA